MCLCFKGGPGCSSFDGLMMEVGPWKIDGKGGLKTVEGGWEEYTHMVYSAYSTIAATSIMLNAVPAVDQPVGTGFSYTSTDRYVHSLPEASEQFVQFLRTWYKVFPEYIDMDVCIPLSCNFPGADGGCTDVSWRREFRRPIHPLFRYAIPLYPCKLLLTRSKS